MMNKEIEILYKIFELELAPPFTLVDSPDYYMTMDISNRRSEEIGWISSKSSTANLIGEKEISVLNKIKQVFNVEKLSNDDVFHIAKHLVIWLQNKLGEDIIFISIWNDDTLEYVGYPYTVDYPNMNDE